MMGKLGNFKTTLQSSALKGAERNCNFVLIYFPQFKYPDVDIKSKHDENLSTYSEKELIEVTFALSNRKIISFVLSELFLRRWARPPERDILYKGNPNRLKTSYRKYSFINNISGYFSSHVKKDFKCTYTLQRNTKL